MFFNNLRALLVTFFFTIVPKAVKSAPDSKLDCIYFPHIVETSINQERSLRTNPEPFLRHTNGMQDLGFHVGISSIGYKFLLEWGYYLAPELALKICLGSEWKNYKASKYKSVYLQPKIYYTALSNDQYFYLNVLGGPILTYIRYKEGKINNSQSNFNVGFFAGLETELFLKSNVALLLGCGPIFFFLKDSYNRLDYYIMAGFKINF